MRIPKRLTGGLTASHRRSRDQERDTAKRLGGQTTPRSGAGKFHKGDVRLKGVLRLDNKTTKHRSFSVTADMIQTLEEHAAMSGEFPVFEVEIDNQGTPRKVYVVPTWALDGLLQPVAEEPA